MTINENVSTFAGLPVREWPADGEPVGGPAAWRISPGLEAERGEFARRLDELIDSTPVEALLVGDWGDCYENPAPIDALVAAAPRLSGLRALFLGEMTFEECEISWIRLGDVAPLFEAFGSLEVLRIRGSEGLRLGTVRHETLRELAFESGGLPAAVVRDVGAGDFPALRHLELWLGTPNYGGDATAEDLAGILSGERLPALRHLGLRNAEIADDVAAALARAPIVPRLTTLDLSLGLLSDTGARALLTGGQLSGLERLDLHHHLVSEEVLGELAAALPGVVLDTEDSQLGERYRYVAVGE
ncbi:STM4015 family protein [Cryptosporangium arvum]|uniref:STM4015 family protein n=1 Tax=Cryptosporangium arvum TaxID=80871 RepID=UPI0005607AD5|nr:STM4015 family protein [Cryptosporangium arvum]